MNGLERAARDGRGALWLLLGALLPAPLGACAADVGAHPEPDPGATATKAEYGCGPVDRASVSAQANEDVAALGIANWGHSTEERTHWLTAYGNRYLAAKQCEVDAVLGEGAPPIAHQEGGVYRISVEAGGCFSDASPWWRAPHDLVDNADVNAVRDQLERVADWLVEFHQVVGGRDNVFFEKVALCPSERVGSMRLESRTLWVGVNWGPLGRHPVVRPLKALQEAWNGGEHLSDTGLDDLRKYWPLVNPRSPAHQAARHAVQAGVSALAERLREARAARSPQLSSLVRTHARPEHRDRLLERLASTAHDPSLRRRVAEEWLRFVEDSRNVQGVTEAAIGAPIVNNSYDLEVVQECGAVSHGNFHDIDVNVGLYLPGTGRFAGYVPRDVKQRIRVHQRGLVCTYSIDDVSVRLNVTGALETAGLDHALDATGI